jgi:hypothetical protein
MEQKVILAGMTLDQTKKITQWIEFTIRMQVMVTLNVATEADLTMAQLKKSSWIPENISLTWTEMRMVLFGSNTSQPSLY